MISLIIPISMGLMAWGLASGASPGRNFNENYLELAGLWITGLAILALLLSYAFNWSWESKYYGAFILPLSSASVMGIYPVLCILVYGTLPKQISTAILFVETMVICWWCRKVVRIYKKISEDKNLFNSIYVEKSDVVYYLLQEDKNILEDKLGFYICPAALYFSVSTLLAFLMCPFAYPLSQAFGIPFTHLFLAVFAAPLNLLFFGVSIKCWLVFYYFPKKIKQETGKRVYVDMSSSLRNYRSGE